MEHRTFSQDYFVYMYCLMTFQSLGHEVVKKTSRTRSEVREALNQRERDVSREAKVNSSLQKAQSLAKNILNLSQSDIDEIMSADGDPERMAMVNYLSSVII